jgi:hypothetical protein
MSQCQALIQQGDKKGQPCGRPLPNGLTEEIYCSKHKRQAILDKAEKEHIRYCDIARGCYTILEDHQVKCTHCLHKARIIDRKRNDKKRQDATLCLDCGRNFTNPQVIRAKGKHDKDLRRCVPCYEKLLKYESQRTVRERNYKAEAFTNKHVIWNHYVKGAQKRNINFALTKTRFNELILLPCFYCTYKKDGEVNGIDRLNNNQGYQEDNVVPCCEPCNIMKGSQHPQEFIDKLYAIHIFLGTATPISEDLIEKWKTTYVSKTPVVYKTYAKNANTRNLQFTLSDEDFAEMIAKPCYLCGVEGSTGIDRFNNSIGYLKENCRPCCGHCNLLKKDIQYEKLIYSAEHCAINYLDLSAFLETKQIPVRSSKVEGRVKVENPVVEEVVPLQYKPLNEVIIPSLYSDVNLLASKRLKEVPRQEIPEEIKTILERKEEMIIPKQWKTKQIYEAIQEGQEHLYKQFCEENNELTETWPETWQTFMEQTKEKSKEDAEKAIKVFVEHLRRRRHNKLCAKDVIEREDREQWPATTVVKAFLEDKLDKFKTYTEGNTGELPEDPTWIKRWSSFMKTLEENKNNEAVLKDRCSKFMTAQRMKKYRAKK